MTRTDCHSNAHMIYPLRASQILDYAGMLQEPLAPTDIDGLIEWRDRAYIIIEVKKRGTPIHAGQRTAIERMVKDFQRVGKSACAILVYHDVIDTQESVYVAEHDVALVYNGKAWRTPKKPCRAGEFVRSTLLFFDKEGKRDG